MRRRQSHRGAALLVVLVMVMVATILAMEFIERSSLELAGGNNVALKTRIEYTAQGGLMWGRAVVLAYPKMSFSPMNRQSFEAGTREYYDLVIGPAEENLPGDPNDTTYTRNIQVTAYKELGDGSKVAQTKLEGLLHYDAAAGTGFYKRIQRP